jgi:hypothetical protein
MLFFFKLRFSVACVGATICCCEREEEKEKGREVEVEDDGSPLSPSLSLFLSPLLDAPIRSSQRQHRLALLLLLSGEENGPRERAERERIGKERERANAAAAARLDGSDGSPRNHFPFIFFDDDEKKTSKIKWTPPSSSTSSRSVPVPVLFGFLPTRALRVLIRDRDRDRERERERQTERLTD